MNVYQAFMVGHIAETIKSIEDPFLLTVCLKAILAQRCRIGGAKEGTCKGCQFQSYYCREMYNISEDELKRLKGDLEDES
jgi:hypothetical protein